MDIASRPSTPVENPETADAAPPPQAPAVIRREEYRPPDWLVPENALDFALGLGQQPADGALRLERHALHPMRGRGLSPHDLFPRPAGCAQQLSGPHDGRQA